MAVPAAELEVVDRVAAPVVKREAVMDFEPVGAAALDADTVALTDVETDLLPGPP